MNASLYINRPQTATIAASPFRQERKMLSNGTAAQVATEKKLYRIGEVSRLADLKPFVLRYWETEFPMLEPVKSSSGHRLYREHDGAPETETRSANQAADGAAQLLSRKMLLDLRDTLRAFLTLLERR